MRPLGFSTGALAKGDFRAGIEKQRNLGVTAVELSALRDRELVPLIQAVDDLDLRDFSYVSLHAPSKLEELDEETVVGLLKDLPLEWSIILHPDVIVQYERWRFLGNRLCIENMDQRKLMGRTVSEMDSIFDELPNAAFCFDIGHARQVDPTMGVAIGLLQAFRDKVRQIHISEVDPSGRHISIGFAALYSFQRVAKLIPELIPVIIESTVGEPGIEREIEVILRALSRDAAEEVDSRRVEVGP